MKWFIRLYFIVKNLNKICGDVNIMRGKPRHRQTQESFELMKRDTKKILASWLVDNKSKDWQIVL
jgi:hypothetical protein